MTLPEPQIKDRPEVEGQRDVNDPPGKGSQQQSCYFLGMFWAQAQIRQAISDGWTLPGPTTDGPQADLKQSCQLGKHGRISGAIPLIMKDLYILHYYYYMILPRVHKSG